MKSITREQVLEWLDYCEETGVFTWKKSNKKRAVAGVEAGCLDITTGYRKICVMYYRQYCHRLAWLVVYGALPTLQIDHIDGNRSNNAIKNLRLATQSQNNQNQRTGRGHRKGQPLGAYRAQSGRWKAMIAIDGKKINLGRFDTQEEASQAYLEAKKQLHPYQTVV